MRAATAGAAGERAQFTAISEYATGKWGRYLRAPSLYFEVMREFGSHFVPLGEIVDVRFGVKSGCDAFFMPHDITSQALDRFPGDRDFRCKYGVDREAVANERVKIVRAGDSSEHPIESEYLLPEVHSLMTLDRPLVQRSDTDRVVLLVSEKAEALKGKLVAKYLKYGESQTFSSDKSRAVPVPKRSTCAARDPWYDLTGLAKPGFVFWPKATQYRHLSFFNPHRLIANCHLYDIAERPECQIEREALTAILNSTLVAR